MHMNFVWPEKNNSHLCKLLNRAVTDRSCYNCHCEGLFVIFKQIRFQVSIIVLKHKHYSKLLNHYCTPSTLTFSYQPDQHNTKKC